MLLLRTSALLYNSSELPGFFPHREAGDRYLGLARQGPVS